MIPKGLVVVRLGMVKDKSAYRKDCRNSSWLQLDSFWTDILVKEKSNL
jgi:hypothetical protein